MQIWVTREDIDEGIPGDRYGCAIAHALRRVFPEAEQVIVDGGSMRVQQSWDSRIWYQKCTVEQLQFMYAFDRHNAVDPILIEFDPERR